MATQYKSSEQILADRLRGERDHYARQLQDAAGQVDGFVGQLEELQNENLALRQLLMDKEDQYQLEIASFHSEMGRIRSQMRAQIEKFNRAKTVNDSDLMAMHERTLQDVYDENEILENKMKFLMRTAALQSPYPPSPVKVNAALDCRKYNPEEPLAVTDGSSPKRYETLAKMTNGRKKLQGDFKMATVEANVQLEKENKMLRSALSESKRVNGALADSLKDLIEQVESATGNRVDTRATALLATAQSNARAPSPKPGLIGTQRPSRADAPAAIAATAANETMEPQGDVAVAAAGTASGSYSDGSNSDSEE